MLRFENRGKLDDLGLDIDSYPQKINYEWFESGF